MRGDTGAIVGVCISHERASVDQLETAAADSERHAVESLLANPEVEEAIALQTCNRTEGYVVVSDHADGSTRSNCSPAPCPKMSSSRWVTRRASVTCSG